MNPAERLLSIYDRLVQQGPDIAIADLWANTFDLDRSAPNLEDDIISCVVAVRQQTDFVRMRLLEKGVPTELMSPGLNRLKDFASPSKLPSSWHAHRGNILPPENRQVFAWASWLLRDQSEADMAEEVLRAMRSEAQSLEKTLVETEMSPYLRDFIQRQIDAIRAALIVYGVQGARPLHSALHKVAGAYTIERPGIEDELAAAPEAAKNLLAKASKLVNTVAETCDSLDKIKKFSEGAWKLGTTVGPLVLPYLEKMAGQ